MLQIIADDLGLYKSVNDGIIFLLKQKNIGGASLMANGEAFEDAVRQCLGFKFSNIGVHLNLVEQRSLVSGKLMPRNHKFFFIKYIFGLVDMEFIQKELEAQLKLIVRSGIKPAFINGNQHLHLLPGIMDITIKLAKEYAIPYIRVVNEPISFRKGKFFRQVQLAFLNFLSKLAENKIKKAGLQCNDHFIGFINAGNLCEQDIKEARNLAGIYPNKIIELGCHPGYEDDKLRKIYSHWGDYHWGAELRKLLQ